MPDVGHRGDLKTGQRVLSPTGRFGTVVTAHTPPGYVWVNYENDLERDQPRLVRTEVLLVIEPRWSAPLRRAWRAFKGWAR